MSEMDELRACLLNTRHPDFHICYDSLAKLASSPSNYCSMFLEIVSDTTASEELKLLAAVHLHSHVRAHSAVHPHTSLPVDINFVTRLFLTCSPMIKEKLREVLEIVGNWSFIHGIGNVKAEVDVFSHKEDLSLLNAALTTIESIFLKLRCDAISISGELERSAVTFGESVWTAFKLIHFWHKKVIGDGIEKYDQGKIGLSVESQNLCCSIFYSINHTEIRTIFRDNFVELMTIYQYYLTTDYRGFENLDAVDGLKTIICCTISLFMKYEGTCFWSYVVGFCNAVMGLLLSTLNLTPTLTRAALNFLVMVSMSSHHTQYLKEAIILSNHFEAIVIGNLILSVEDEDKFWLGFVENDTKDSVRSVASKLLKGIANFKCNEVSDKIHNFIQANLNNPNERMKEAAIYILIYVVSDGEIPNNFGIALADIFHILLLPELENGDINSSPLLKIGALKFLTTFRDRIPTNSSDPLLPKIIKFLHPSCIELHSYAAACIEKFVSVEDEGARDVDVCLDDLMKGMFKAIKHPVNIHVIKSFRKVLTVANMPRKMVLAAIRGLVKILYKARKKPENTLFNHYLFDSIAVLIKRTSEHDSSLVTELENVLLPALNFVISEKVKVFFSYSFQLVAQLVDMSQCLPHQNYLITMDNLLQSEWEATNVPAFVRYFRAILRKAPNHVGLHLSRLVEKVKVLLSSPTNVEEGFKLLTSVIENVDYSVVSYHMVHIWRVLAEHLEGPDCQESLEDVVIIIALFLMKHGFQNLARSINAANGHFLPNILENHWVPIMMTIKGSMKIRLVSIASFSLLFESSSPLSRDKWSDVMIENIVAVVSRIDEECDDLGEEGLEVPDFGEFEGYTAKFVPLENAGWIEGDHATLRGVKGGRDPKTYMIRYLDNALITGNQKYDPMLLVKFLEQLKGL